MAGLSQHCSNTQVRVGLSEFCKLKAALISTERLHVAESKNYSNSLSVQPSTLTCAKHSVAASGYSPYKYPLLRFNFGFFFSI